MHLMSKVEDSAAIPEPGRKIPESESLPRLEAESSLSQTNGNEPLMTVEMALVRALLYLAENSDNSQP